ncbi:MAG: hypothetical protein H7Z14_10255 [Anaerolineae bacterium]|nr:hypothetical protein [Phycisphaerae bacterium]
MSTSRDHRNRSKSIYDACERLEPRRLMCGGHYNFDSMATTGFVTVDGNAGRRRG